MTNMQLLVKQTIIDALLASNANAQANTEGGVSLNFDGDVRTYSKLCDMSAQFSSTLDNQLLEEATLAVSEDCSPNDPSYDSLVEEKVQEFYTKAEDDLAFFTKGLI